MLIQFFRNSQPATLIALPFLVLLCWVLAHVNISGQVVHDGMPLATVMMDLTSYWPTFWKTALGFVLVTFQAIYLNQLTNHHEILYKQTNLTGFWYVLLIVMVPGGLLLGPVLIANTLFIFLLNKTLKMYKLEEPTGTIFDSTFIIGISTLFFLPSIVLLPVFFIALSTLRPFSAREWLVGITGLLIPFILVWSFAFLKNDVPELFESYSQAFNHYTFNSGFSENIYINLNFGLLATILLFALLKLRANIFKNVIRTRKYQRLIFTFLLAAGFAVAAGNPWSGQEFQLLVPPLAIILAYYFLATKKVWWTEGLTILLIASIILRYLNEPGMVQ